jgi:hypothetical protein
MRQFIHVVEDDDRYIAFIKKIKSGVYDVDKESKIGEIETMHLRRSVRKITPKLVLKNAQNQIIKITSQDQAFRSRCVELKMECLKKIIRLEEEMSTIKKYLAVKYVKHLTDLPNEKIRTSAMDNIVGVAIKRLKNLEEVKVLADLLIEDVDATGWSIKRIIETLSIYSRDA